MEEELISEGKCIYCEQLLSQKEIGKHLAKHLADKEKADIKSTNQTYCHILVETGPYFLHLLVKGNSKMIKLDTFLRDIWLECCDHLSEFRQKNLEIDMDDKVLKIFEPKIKIIHEYDYGSTTRLDLKALKLYQLNLKDTIILLSRNEPFKIMCSTCKKELAVNMCTVCGWDSDSYFCKKCSKKHEKVCADFEDYASMPMVNSPRMGVCGYMGGLIDKERDTVYKE